MIIEPNMIGDGQVLLNWGGENLYFDDRKKDLIIAVRYT